MYACNANYTVECLSGPNVVVGCCPNETQCSAWGCTREIIETDVFVSTTALIWSNLGVLILVIAAGLSDFAAGTLYYWSRRRQSAQRLQRSQERELRVTVNPEERTEENNRNSFFFSMMARAPVKLKPVSELDGVCCGCGEVANTVLLPCKHAVCCSVCGVNASRCPFCNAVCTDRQRLFPV